MTRRYHLTIALPESMHTFLEVLSESSDQQVEDLIAQLLEYRIRQLARDTRENVPANDYVTGFGGEWVS